MLDPEIETIRTQLEEREDKHFELRDGLVYRKGKDKLLFYVPRDMINQIVKMYHDDFGHFSIEKVFELINRSYWFPNMKEKIKSYIKNCLKCIVYSKKNFTKDGNLNLIDKGSVPFHTIHIDHYGPLTLTNSNFKYIFVIVECVL